MGSQRTTARVHSHARISAIGRHQDDAGHWRAAILAGFAIVAGLIVPLWLQGYATGKFWILWPLASLITSWPPWPPRSRAWRAASAASS